MVVGGGGGGWGRGGGGGGGGGGVPEKYLKMVKWGDHIKMTVREY